MLRPAIAAQAEVPTLALSMSALSLFLERKGKEGRRSYRLLIHFATGP
ncbi:hypothetical protein COMA2_70089 [Candidatus Nitrospira nitrificans]|uniref:Uncharacterized protein n=1 Tax=Candidatus Nitrospira nitrificans TaxID=1742973 RepID=A0A0S4LRK0_9BACT|nr:hypothetical protein COMA2_70089 [Candidatus Nitrospira nitrificans]